MPEPTPKDRAEQLKNSLTRAKLFGVNDPPTDIADLLADLMHLIDAELDSESERDSFDSMLETARMNYEEEVRERSALTKRHTKPYNGHRIAWELERTAKGDGFYGNALRVAKDIPGLTDEDRALLDRYATGGHAGTDHVKLQDLALRVAALTKEGA